MTLPNPRVDYRVDPTGREERLLQAKIVVSPVGLVHHVDCGCVHIGHVILVAAARYASQVDGRIFNRGIPRREEPRHG